jgi:hypothetical protein
MEPAPDLQILSDPNSQPLTPQKPPVQPQPVPSPQTSSNNLTPPTKKHIPNFFKDKIRLGVIFFILPFLMILIPRNIFLMPLILISFVAPAISAVLFTLKALEDGVKTTKKIELFVASEGILILWGYIIAISGAMLCFDQCPHLTFLYQAFFFFLLLIDLALIIFILFKAISVLKKKPQIPNSTSLGSQ